MTRAVRGAVQTNHPCAPPTEYHQTAFDNPEKLVTGMVASLGKVEGNPRGCSGQLPKEASPVRVMVTTDAPLAFPG
jgi:hypothetical protein